MLPGPQNWLPNLLSKCADDTYLTVGTSRRDDIPAELDHIPNWAASNNLRLNPGKSREMIISRKRKYDSQPKQNADIERVKSMKILGVILNNKPRAADHVRAILNNCSRSLYALRILKTYGLQSQVIHKVTEATLMSRLLYASPSLVGTNNNKG